MGGRMVQFPKPLAKPNSPSPRRPAATPERAAPARAQALAKPSAEPPLKPAAPKPVPVSPKPVTPATQDHPAFLAVAADTDPSFRDAVTNPRGTTPGPAGAVARGDADRRNPDVGTFTVARGDYSYAGGGDGTSSGVLVATRCGAIVSSAAGIKMPDSYTGTDTIPAAAETYKLPAVQNRVQRRRWTIGALTVAAVAVLIGVIARVVFVSAPPSRLAVSSVPPGARVALNGQPLAGLTPMRNVAELERGERYEVVVTLDGYEPWSMQLIPNRDEVPVVAVLRGVQRELIVETRPVDANAPIYVDGVQHGRGQIHLTTLREGATVHIEARFRNQRKSTDIQVNADMPSRVVLDLTR